MPKLTKAQRSELEEIVSALAAAQSYLMDDREGMKDRAYLIITTAMRALNSFAHPVS